MTAPAACTKDSRAEAPAAVLRLLPQRRASAFTEISVEECGSSTAKVFLWTTLDREKWFLLNA